MSESMKQINDRLVQDNVDLKCESEGKVDRIAELEAENARLRSRRLPCREAEVAQARYEKAEAELAKRDETMTIAYRLWLQGCHEEVGDYLLPFSTDLKRRAEAEKVAG